MEHKIEENIIHEATNSPEKSQGGFEMTTEQASQITAELSKLNEAILHDKPIFINDLEDLSKIARGTKIDVGGEIMTVEEAESIPDLKMNAKIWQEMKEGNFLNTDKLTKITPTVSKYLENIKGDLNLRGLTSAKGLVLPQTIGGDLYLNGLTSAEGLVLPNSIKKDLWLSRLTSTEGLALSQTIEGDLVLSVLTSAEGLVLPQSIVGGLKMNSLTSAKGLVLPESIGGHLYISRLTSADKEELKKKYPQFANQIK